MYRVNGIKKAKLPDLTGKMLNWLQWYMVCVFVIVLVHYLLVL